MLIEVLRQLESPGVKSLQGISSELGISIPMLEQLLSDLERRDYIKRIEMCGSGCSSCGHACPFSGGNSVSIATWETTEKGVKLLKRRAN